MVIFWINSLGSTPLGAHWGFVDTFIPFSNARPHVKTIEQQVNPNWPDWDNGTGTHNPIDIKQADANFAQKEARRERMNKVDDKVQFANFILCWNFETMPKFWKSCHSVVVCPYSAHVFQRIGMTMFARPSPPRDLQMNLLLKLHRSIGNPTNRCCESTIEQTRKSRGKRSSTRIWKTCSSTRYKVGLSLRIILSCWPGFQNFKVTRHNSLWNATHWS